MGSSFRALFKNNAMFNEVGSLKGIVREKLWSIGGLLNRGRNR